MPRDLAEVEEDHTPRVSRNQNDHDAQDVHHETALHLYTEYVDKKIRMRVYIGPTLNDDVKWCH